MSARTLRSIVRRVKRIARRASEDLVRTLAGDLRTRWGLNVLYRRVPLPLTGTFHARFAKLFRGAPRRFHAGQWKLEFAGKSVFIALRPKTAWLDWDAAMSLLGHEVEIKRTYAAMIRSQYRPNLFVDVGANYGLHSLLFLVHGIPTLSFEPNPECGRYFRELCVLNSVEPSVVEVALGDGGGWTDLWFPEDETWLGTVDREVRDRVAAGADLVSCRVKKERLDQYLAELDRRRILMKIDTEGSEVAVLNGAARTLERHRPFIIFESFRGAARDRLHSLLNDFEYAITWLPWSPEQAVCFADRRAFQESPASNFLALPLEQFR